MVKCKQCGNEFDEQFGVCPKCGWVYEAEEKLPEIKPPADTLPELKEYSDEKSAGKKKPKTKLFVIIGIIAAVFILGIASGIIIATSIKGGTSEAHGNTESKTEESGKPEESIAEEVSKEEYKDPEYTLGTIVASGDCGKDGDNVTWQLDDKGLLVISGSGEMKDFQESTDIPWYEKQKSIKTVIVKKGVTSIGASAFDFCKSLTSITIPDSVTSIGEYAFDNCKNLTSITIPDSVTSIGYKAFAYCTRLTSITIPDSVTSIGEYAFYDCTSLTSITIPDSVTSIGSDAFYDTAWYNSQPDGVVYAGKVAYSYKGEMPVEHIVLKEGTKGIAGGAFQKCTSLTSITIPDSVTSIGDGAFYVCTSLTSITIPDSVTSIGDYAFKYCTSLTSITIPDSVTSIGMDAFSAWSSSQTIYIKGRSSAPSGWNKHWNDVCDAKIVWNA